MMHPEIRKYWEKIGTIEEKHFPLFKTTEYRCLYKDNSLLAIIAIIKDDGSGEYYLEGKSRSEEESLRILKLKAFL